MKPTIVHLCERSGDAGHFSIKQTLEDALDRVGKRGAFEKGKKVLIIALDDTEENYNISFIQCGMRMSECITLSEIAKIEFLKAMKYIPEQ